MYLDVRTARLYGILEMNLEDSDNKITHRDSKVMTGPDIRGISITDLTSILARSSFLCEGSTVNFFCHKLNNLVKKKIQIFEA